MKYNLSPEKSRRPGIAKRTGVALTTAASLAVAACGHASGQSHNNGHPQNTPVGVETTQDDGGQGGGEGTANTGILSCIANAIDFRYDVNTVGGRGTEVDITYDVSVKPGTSWLIVNQAMTREGPLKTASDSDEGLINQQVTYSQKRKGSNDVVAKLYYPGTGAAAPRPLRTMDELLAGSWQDQTYIVNASDGLDSPNTKVNALSLTTSNEVPNANQYTDEQKAFALQSEQICGDRTGGGNLVFAVVSGQSLPGIIVSGFPG